MLVRVDPSRPEPLYEQLAAGIRASIVDGRIAYGERLPSARALGESLDLNLHTVLRAYRMLRDERMIELHPGRGRSSRSGSATTRHSRAPSTTSSTRHG